MHERPDLAEPLTPVSATVGAEIVYTIQNEMAVRLSDIVIRRTGLGVSDRPDDATIRAAAKVAAAELQWDGDRTADEIAIVQRFYAID